MDKKIKIVALFGESGSGKDTIQNHVVSLLPNTNKIISATTREARGNEKDGEDYFFLTKDNFINEIDNNEMLEYTIFNNWYYGTPKFSLDENKINIGVFNIEGIKSLLKNEHLDVIPIYICSPNKDRLIRALTREDLPNCYEICRRFIRDVEDFNYIPFEYIEVFNGTDHLLDSIRAVAKVVNSFQ